MFLFKNVYDVIKKKYMDQLMKNYSKLKELHHTLEQLKLKQESLDKKAVEAIMFGSSSKQE